MPEEPLRQGLLPAPERRHFLVVAGKLLALMGLSTLPLEIARWLRIEPRRSQVSSVKPEPPLSSNRVPAWHPRCSAFHRDGLLTIRMETNEKTFEQLVLADKQARLWCLCGGMWSEAELATTLARECDMPEDEAAREVASFVRPLYQQEFLIAEERGRFFKPLVRETDGSLSAGEIAWQSQRNTN